MIYDFFLCINPMTLTQQIKKSGITSAIHFISIIWPKKHQDNDYWIKI